MNTNKYILCHIQPDEHRIIKPTGIELDVIKNKEKKKIDKIKVSLFNAHSNREEASNTDSRWPTISTLSGL